MCAREIASRSSEALVTSSLLMLGAPEFRAACRVVSGRRLRIRAGKSWQPKRSTGAQVDPTVEKGPVAGARAGRAVRPPSLSQLEQIPVSTIPVVNVAAVPQRSPLRYPGGKTWLIPHVRTWLERIRPVPRRLVEPFAGGGIVSLTAVMENLVARCFMVELDHDVAAFWHAALRHGPELRKKIQRFKPTQNAVDQLSRKRPADVLEHGFRTLVLNRTRRGGVLASGAASIRQGENGKGVASRWYRDTLVKRLQAIADHADRINFCETDGMQFLDAVLENCRRDTAVFVDPPYTAGGKLTGRRLYKHTELDHVRLFEILAKSRLNFLMTYDCNTEILSLARKHGFHTVQVTMKNAHHDWVPELIITPQPVFG